MTKKISWIAWIPMSSFAMIIVSVYAAWLAAFSQLGRRPLPSMDDPKFIGGFATTVFEVMSWLVLFSVAAWIIGMIVSTVVSVRSSAEGRRHWIVKSLFGALAIPLLIVCVRYSPGDAFTWFID